MKPTNMVYVILAFGIIMSLVIPHLTEMAYSNETYKSEKQEELAGVTQTVEENKEVEEAANVELAVATPIAEEVVPEVTEEPIPVIAEAVHADPIVYDNLTMAELSAKLNKNLKSALSGTGETFAKYALDYGVDPYLAVAIVLHETGCNWSCSTKVTQCNNVGGMKSGSSTKCGNTSYASFATLDEGIRAFISNLKENYYDYGLNTPELMNSKYASSTAWAGKINSYINKIKNS